MKLIALAALMVIINISVGKAQDTICVQGVVMNGVKMPVPDVSVAVEGTYEMPAVTNENGIFTIKTTKKNAWLNIEPSGRYKSKRIFLNNRTKLIVFLTDNDLESGDDQISLLSQKIPRRNIISSFNVLNTADINHTPEISIDRYFQGRISGMHTVNLSGDFGSGALNLLRGVNSLNSSNQPLYIVDRIPMYSSEFFRSVIEGYSYNPLLIVNPLDISKVTVVKDPIYTAAYGSKASNGIVFIETIEPSATKTIIDFDFRTGYSLSPSRYIPQLDAGEHKTLINELLFSSGMYEELVREKFPNLFLNPDDDRYIDYQHNTKWQDLIFSNSTFYNLNFSIKGGDEIARYGFSFGYMNGGGIIKSTDYQGYNLRFVGLLNIFSWLRMNTNVALGYNMSQLKESGKTVEANPVLTSLGKSPLLNPFIYDLQGQELRRVTEVDELGVSNPYAVIYNYEANNTNSNFITTLGFEATLKSNAFLNSDFGISYNLLEENVFMPNMGMEHYYKGEAYNVSKATTNTFRSFYNNTCFSLNKSLGDCHYLASQTGINVLTNNFEFDWALTKNSHENDQYRMLQDGTDYLREIGGKNHFWNWISLYENMTYIFKDKYLASLTLSLDGSSRIGRNAANTLKVGKTPLGVFYSTGAAWRLSNENFLKNKSWLEELKLRLTYGRSGNDDIGELNASKYYDAKKFRETVGLYPAVINNDDLTYETVTQINAGLDISLWGNRLFSSIDFYNSISDQMLIYRPLKAYFGYDFRPENAGKMENTGIDFNLNIRIIDRTGFKWNIQGTYSTFNNQILEIEGDKNVTEIHGAEIVNMVGEKANSFYGYVFKGVYSTSEEAENSGLINNKYIPYREGDAIFADLSGPNDFPDGIINSYDKIAIGSSLPDHFAGINNLFNYKRWTLKIFMQAITGNELFNYIRYRNERMSGLENQSSSVLNRWQYEGQITSVPRAVYNDPAGNSSFSTRWIEDGSYLKIKNISLIYTISDRFIAFRNAQFYISASNIFTFSKYLGYYPEFGHSKLHVEQGIDYGLTPQPRQFMMGVKLGL